MLETHTPLLNLDQLRERVLAIDPVQYAQTRNFVDGAVTGLSPYIARGVISTKWVYDTLVLAGHSPRSMEKLIQELAWRDYWQLRWEAKPGAIDPQGASLEENERGGLPSAIYLAETGISALDAGIAHLYRSGRMHNHVRMYVASVACNVAQCNWLAPAQWLYYHLLDADWGSNALSWQWVCGAVNGKKYYANQENINYYTRSVQAATFLDRAYEDFPTMPIPTVLQETVSPVLTTVLPDAEPFTEVVQAPCFIYNFYNVDPQWHQNEQGVRLLLLEPSVFAAYPVHEQTIAWLVALAQFLIPSIRVVVAEFYEIAPLLQGPVYYKAHPLNKYKGIEEARDYLCDVRGFYPSFFAYWKRAKKQLIP
jgi:deoxyribodipyrimidine photo-lyase